MKRLRFEVTQKVRFYACGEYGEKLGRPHYHICLFNFDPPDKRMFKMRDKIPVYTSEMLDRIWGKGFTLTGSVTFQSAAYVARYIMKKVNGPESTNHYENVDPETGEITKRKAEFTVMSRRPGIGKAWYEKYKSEVFDHDYVVINGKKMRPPRFYDQCYEVTDLNDYRRIKRQRVVDARQHAHDQVPSRLAVRETVQLARLIKLNRDFEKD